jgi:hypothetical protein
LRRRRRAILKGGQQALQSIARTGLRVEEYFLEGVMDRMVVVDDQHTMHKSVHTPLPGSRSLRPRAA